MKCHYEVLGLSMKANDEEIKRAYRKLALQWHPDKNPDNIQECTQQFNLIQQAYDVLIDPQERAWYDRHRDAILKGGLDEHYEDNSLNLFPYFCSSCYSGYGDDEKGFYTVYRHVFETIVNEDVSFMEDQEAEVKKIPMFGDSASNYDQVVGPFYGHWQSYCTTKSYAWLDKFDIQQAPNRQVLRAMEKENKKVRDAARKERNEEVRALVAFVRKRDRRVQAYRRLLQEQRLEQMKKVEEHRRTQIASRLKELSEYKEADWHDNQAREDALKGIEAQLAEDFGDAGSDSESDSRSENSDDEQDSSSLYCPACEKAFKTAKAYQNHENSKKHKENVKLLRLHMTEEEMDALQLDCGTTDGEIVDGRNQQKKSKRNRKKAKEIEKMSDESDEDVGTVQVATEEVQEAEKEAAGEKNEKGLVERTNEAKSALCDTCQETFSSRNKLFDHLKSTGHAALKYQDTAGAGQTNKKQKDGKRAKRVR